MKRKKLVIVGILLFVLLAVSVIFIIKGWKGDNGETTVTNIKYKDLALNRTRIYLLQGTRYALNLQLDSHNAKYGYGNKELEKALQEDTKWKSMDDSIATVDEDGVVTAVRQGETFISVKFQNGIYECEIQVLPADPETEIPIHYCNDIFNEELYHQIDKAQLGGTSISGYLEGKYEISSVYAMLAGCKEFEFERDYTEEDKYLTGIGGVVFTLKDGRTVEVYLAGLNEILYQNKFYRCYYGEESGYGGSFGLCEEMVRFLYLLRKKDQFWADNR